MSLTFATISNAQDVQIEGTEGELITVAVSGFADSERSKFNYAQTSGGSYVAAPFDKNTGKISFTFSEPNTYSFDFYEDLEGCINSTSVSFVIKEKTKPEPEPEPEPQPEPEPEPEPEPQPEPEPEPEPQPPLPDKESITLNIPNIFTPNGDGINDGFHINYNIRPEGFSIHIFTRNGQKVYSSANPDFVWDGDGMSNGTYFYIISYNDIIGTRTLSGNVMIAQ